MQRQKASSDPLWAALERIITAIDLPRTIATDLAGDNPAIRDNINRLAGERGLATHDILEIFEERDKNGDVWRRQLIVQHPGTEGPLSIIVWTIANTTHGRDPIKAGKRAQLVSCLQAWQKKVMVASRNSSPSRPVESQSELDFQVRTHVLANHALYIQAGRDIDTTYSAKAFWERDLSFYKAQPSYPVENYPTLEQWRSPSKRIGKVVLELLEHYCHFRGIPPLERAARVVLVHWLLTDESCNTAPVKLTEFQNWEVPGGADHGLMHAHGWDLADNTEWREYVRKALAVMQTQSVAREIVDPSSALSNELNRFYATLDATTTVGSDGRKIGPAPHAITLSHATCALHEVMAAVLPTALTQHDQSVMAAITSAAEATGWPVDRHNREQSGGWPYRWEPGEQIPTDMLLAIDQVRKLLKIFPLQIGYNRPAPVEVLDAIRKVIADWDGTNWAAVRAVLANDGKNRADIEAMTLDDVRQYFAVGQRRIILHLGGQPYTATNTLVSIDSVESANRKSAMKNHGRKRRIAVMEAKPLTDRERQAVQFADEGHGPTAIGKRMGVAKSYAATLRDNGRKKLKALQLAIRASGNSARPKASISDVQFNSDDD